MAKICMIAYTAYANDPRVRREAEALVARGDQVDFICVREGAGPGRDCNGVRLYPLSVARYRGDSTVAYIATYVSLFIKSFALVTWLFLRKRYDLVQVHTMPDFLVFAALVPKLFGAKIILDVHDLMPELYICKFGAGKRALVIRLITWMERRSIAFAHRAIAVHVPHRDVLVNRGNPVQKFGVVLNVPDPAIFHRKGAARADGKFRLIYHGTVARRHGVEIALGALRRINGQIPNLEFLIIGGGDDLERIKGLVGSMGLQTYVRFVEPVPVERLPDYLQQADLGLVPLVYDSFTRYMLPLKLLEYVRMDIPAIVSETETIRAYFDEQMVRFCKPGDVGELADAIVELHQSPHKREVLTSNAQRFNSTYNWEEQKMAYFEVVDSLLPEHTKPRSTIEATGRRAR
jgi:glycosyltransferase involved in cell wall biosynthesis